MLFGADMKDVILHPASRRCRIELNEAELWAFGTVCAALGFAAGIALALWGFP